MNQHKNKSSHTVASVMRAKLQNNRSNCTVKAKRHKRAFNRSLLPTPASYYTEQFPGLKIKSEWVKVRCCFHQPDINPSLHISMVGGHFKCFSCDAKGCDVIAFHRLRYGVSFADAVTFMGAWNHE
jgi:hypothetical protein